MDEGRECLGRSSECECVLEDVHECPHRCACGGSWEDRDGEFRIFAWPGSDPAWKGGADVELADAAENLARAVGWEPGT